jgi:uncharacterized protein
MSTSVVRRIAEVPADDWDALAGRDNPFVEHAFLALLEESGCVGARTAWQPRHLLVRDEAGVLVGAAPCYLRTDSYGEFIFDWSWAQAAARAGLDYYPKLTCAVPFTPATGPRLLVHPGAETTAVRAHLAAGMRALAAEEGCSSSHVLFCRDEEAASLEGVGFSRRASLQFHWRNAHPRPWASFEEFLAALRHEDRKQIRRERRRVREAGVELLTATGDEVPAGLWPSIYALYTSTSARKWGRPYLTRSFFDELPRVLGARAVLGLARRGGALVAMALSFERDAHIYGRYWGASEEIPGLHFELCYYTLIERALARGATLLEAGAQGEHKLKRGFLPVLTHSAHHIEDARFGAAVERFLRQEHAAVQAERDELLAHSPFREGSAPARPLRAGIDDL